MAKNMKGVENAGSWIVLHGWEWAAHRQMEPALVTALEARRMFHFDGTERLQADVWVLDYHFCENIRFRPLGSSTWKKRTPATWHLYPPGFGYHQDTRRGKLPVHAIWIRFHGAEKFGLSKLVNNPTHMARIHDPAGWLLHSIRALTTLGDTRGEGDYSSPLIGLMEIVKRLVECHARRPGVYDMPSEADQKTKDPLVTAIDLYLDDHLAETVTLAKIARAVHASATTLKRHYTRATGKSITKQLILQRIDRVKKLLRQGMTVAEAAEQTGFCDQFHLSKTFRQAEGIPPRQFIRSLRQTTPAIPAVRRKTGAEGLQ